MSLSLIYLNVFHLYFSDRSGGVHPGSDVDGVAPDVVLRLLSADDSSNDGTDTDSCKNKFKKIIKIKVFLYLLFVKKHFLTFYHMKKDDYH
jgi:hypothetical protein